MKINTCPFYIVFQVLKVLFIKICKIQPLDLLFLVVFVAFTSEGIIFHKVLELHSTLSEKKKDFCLKFSFFNRFTKPHSLQAKSAKHDKSFLLMLTSVLPIISDQVEIP